MNTTKRLFTHFGLCDAMDKLNELQGKPKTNWDLFFQEKGHENMEKAFNSYMEAEERLKKEVQALSF